MSLRFIGRVAVLAAVAVAGCSSFPLLYPLTGTITYNGKPITSGGLLFQPPPGQSGGYIVNASINPDGTFTAETSLVTSSGTEIVSGAPNGRYTVVYHPISTGENAGPGAELPDAVVVEGKAVMVDLVIPMKPKDEPKLKDEPPAK